MIVVAGESLIDLILDPAGRVDAVPGGGPYNTARTVARLGGQCAYLGRLSTDRFGQLLRNGLDADGVDTGSAVATDAPTTLAIADLDLEGTATYHFYVDGTSAPGLTAEAAVGVLARGVEALHVGTLGLVLEPIATSLERLLGRIGPDVLVMVDPNCRAKATPDPAAYRERIARLLVRCDVVKVSADDLAFLDPDVPPEEAARGLLARGPALVLLTDGGRAVQLVTRASTRSLPVPLVPIVDTVGSGDAFGGGFLAWWRGHGLGRDALHDDDAVERAARTAIRVAAITCQRQGADPPTLAELGGWD